MNEQSSIFNPRSSIILTSPSLVPGAPFFDSALLIRARWFFPNPKVSAAFVVQYEEQKFLHHEDQS